MRILLTAIFVAWTVVVHATTVLKEDFNTLKSGTSYAGDVTLPSGTWRMNGVAGNTSNGITSVKFNNSSAYIISPSYSKVAKVGFLYRSGGSNKDVTVGYSLDGGSTWTDVETFRISSSSSSFAAYSKKVALADAEGVCFRVTCASSNVYVDDFAVTLADEQGGGGTVTDPDDPTYITTGVPIPTKPFAEAKNTYYISPNGSDTEGDGTIEKPWYNLAVAYAKAQAGDHIVCRGGTYRISRYGTDGKLTIRMNKKGTQQEPITIRNYMDEKPVMDFEQQLLDCNRDKSKVGDRGILLSGDYHVIFGIHFMHAADNAIKLEGSHNRIERCEFSYNLDTGIQLGFGHNFAASGFGSKNDGSYCSYNDIVDCDSHHNCDFDMNYGSDADGFACKMHNGKGNRFIRCRAWRNSDDAWDLFETDYSVVLAECWAWESGKPEDHTWVKEYLDGSASFSGNGNGIKLGGNGTGGSSMGVHYAYNCIAFGCNKSGSVKGFDCNHHKDGHVLIGCLGFDNGYDYMFESGGSSASTFYYNNVCLGRQEICVGTDNYNAVNSAASKNGWTNHLVTGANKDDYVTLEEEDALLPRSIDGSFPRRFGRLCADSKLLNAGSADYDLPVGTAFDELRQVIADYPFLKHEAQGTARDLGPYERADATTSIHAPRQSPLQQNGEAYQLQGTKASVFSHGIIVTNGKKLIRRFSQP